MKLIIKKLGVDYYILHDRPSLYSTGCLWINDNNIVYKFIDIKGAHENLNACYVTGGINGAVWKYECYKILCKIPENIMGSRRDAVPFSEAIEGKRFYKYIMELIK